MTNWEWITSDKERFAMCIRTEHDFYDDVTGWWCGNACPHSENGECRHEACIDTHTMHGIIMMYLDAEHED